MKYTFKWEGKEITLKPYTLINAGIVEEIGKQINDKGNELKIKVGYVFAGVKELCVGTTAEELFGPEEELDVNDVFIFFEMLRETYRKPLNDYRAKQLKQTISESGISQLRSTVAPLSNIAKLAQQSK